jgi:hypothetical protein
MVAAGDLKMAAIIGKGACFYIFNPGAIHTQRYFIFAFTSGGTGVATNTLAIVDDETVIHKFLLPLSRGVPLWSPELGRHKAMPLLFI